MKGALLLLALLVQTAALSPDPHRFHYVRGITVPAGSGNPRVCAALDGTVYEHASPGLADVRLFSDGGEVPYVLTLSDTPAASSPAKVLNLGLRGHDMVFDLEMPHRLYSRVDLDLNLHDFVAIAKVTGSNRPGEAGTLLGSFDLFDFLTDGRARNTSVALAEASFPYLHFEITPLGKGHAAHDLAPSAMRGAVVPPSRLAQTIYTTIASTTEVKREGRSSVASFQVAAHVPVERIRFELGNGGPRNFSRTVNLRASADGDAHATLEEVGGTIARINMTEEGEKLHQQTLTVPATVGSNAQSPATIEVEVDNGDDQPIDIHAALLEMRERKICFDATAAPVQMFYGDTDLKAPEYDYGRIFNPTAPARVAMLEHETPNPGLAAPVDHRTFAERNPHILWAALIAVIVILGLVAFGSARRV